MISTRTKVALAAAKARGVVLGSPKLAKARKNAIASIKALADQHASMYCRSSVRYGVLARGRFIRLPTL